MKCAVVDIAGKVTNIIEADPLVDAAPDGFKLVPFDNKDVIDTRWTYDEVKNEFSRLQIIKPLTITKI